MFTSSYQLLVCEFQFCVKYIHVHRLVTFEEISEYKMFNVQCFSSIFCLPRFVFILFYFCVFSCLVRSSVHAMSLSVCLF